MIEQILRDAGLTGYEAKIYLALLELGESTSGKILSKAKIHSGKVYELLDSLKEKGFVAEVVKNGVRHFSPAEPSRILDYINQKKKNVEDQEEHVKSILPELMGKIQSSKAESHVEVFTGYNGLKAVHEKEKIGYSKDKTLKVMGVQKRGEYPTKIENFYLLDMYPKREKSGIKIQKILSTEAKAEGREQEKQTAVRYLPYNSLSATTILDDLVIIGIYSGEMLFISIESKEIAKSFSDNFDVLWKMSKK